jgi:alpha-tubulin suppressor-like RCC1 family protein
MFLTKQSFTVETNNSSWFKFKSILFFMNRLSSQPHKAMVLFSALLLSLTLIGCGGGGGGESGSGSGGSGDSSGDDNSSVVIKNKSIAVGYHQSFIIDNGQVYATGKNGNNELGLGDTANRNIFTRILSLNNIAAVASGNGHSLALSNDGKVYSSGANQDGRIGFGDKKDRTAFAEISFLSDKNITAIAAADKHSLALSNDGRVYATGVNIDGRLGLGDYNNRTAFMEVKSLSGITAITIGDSDSFALSNDGKVYATGYNGNGQLGVGDNNGRNTFTEALFLRGKNIFEIATGYDHSFALSSDGKVYTTGKNDNGQLGLGDYTDRNTFTEVSSLSGKNIVAISAFGSHSLALSSDGRVYAAGNNYNGQLGLGDNNKRNTFIEVSSLKDIYAISAGHSHSIALSNDGKVYGVGNNTEGQLGLGDYGNRNIFTEISVP